MYSHNLPWKLSVHLSEKWKEANDSLKYFKEIVECLLVFLDISFYLYKYF